jgi:hypothetical protein
MSYDQNKGQESNEVRLECAIHCWKDIFEGYKIFPRILKKNLDLRKI